MEQIAVSCVLLSEIVAPGNSAQTKLMVKLEHHVRLSSTLQCTAQEDTVWAEGRWSILFSLSPLCAQLEGWADEDRKRTTCAEDKDFPLHLINSYCHRGYMTK